MTNEKEKNDSNNKLIKNDDNPFLSPPISLALARSLSRKLIKITADRALQYSRSKLVWRTIASILEDNCKFSL